MKADQRDHGGQRDQLVYTSEDQRTSNELAKDDSCRQLSSLTIVLIVNRIVYTSEKLTIVLIINRIVYTSEKLMIASQ